MDAQETKQEALSPKQRREQAIRMCAPGTSLRMAIDMIIAGHLGALITIGDEDAVIAAGNDGFKLDVSFTASRLFELSKMDGAVVIDKDFTKILGVCIGKQTRAAAEEYGFKTIMAEKATIDAMCECILKDVSL